MTAPLASKKIEDAQGKLSTPEWLGDRLCDGSSGEYARLKRLIRQSGCLDRQYRYYTGKIALTLALFAGALGALALSDRLLIQILDAAFLALVFGQVGLLGHDAAHNQICRSPRWNRALAFLHFNLLTGISLGWWHEKHNQHHAYPNQLARDPDIDFPVIAFCEDQARATRGFTRFMVKYQPYFFVPLLLLEAFNLRLQTLRTLLRGKSRWAHTEVPLTIVHFAGFLGFAVAMLGPTRAVLFVLVHHAVTGLYLGWVFAPNHIGMRILEADSRMDFLRRQVLTTRNVRSHPLVDFWYGGLNYQIEHHLFPSMPRNQLRRARRLVKGFCAAEGIPYCETGMLRSYSEVLKNLHAVSAQLRVGRVGR